MKLDSEQLECRFRTLQLDVSGLARQHPVEAQRRDQTARRCFAGQGLLPVEPAHADHQALFALAPDDVGNLHPGVLHVRRDDRQIIGIKSNQFELGRHR